MVLWIESQDVAVIALVLFGLCYGLAAIIFIATAIVSPRRIAAELRQTTPVIMTPLAIIFGLLIAFLAARVWSNLDRANAYIAQEASAIRESVLLAETLSGGTPGAVRGAVKKYLQFIEAEDWPAMAESRANLRRPPPDLTEAMTALLSFVPAAPGQQVAQQRAVVAIEQALEARRNRILLSQATIAPIQWLVIFILAGLLLLTIAMVNIDQHAAAAVSLFFFATALAACLVLLMAHDRPFARGGFSVEPEALRSVGVD